MILVHFGNLHDESIELTGYSKETAKEVKGWFVADSLSFGVEREVKESGEKMGTGDLNIGVGECQEVSISKSMDTASMLLAQYAINGNSPDKGGEGGDNPCIIDYVEVAGEEEAGTSKKPVCYLRYKLARPFIKSWSTSGDADDRPTEEVTIVYNKIAIAYAYTKDGKTFQSGGEMSWDNKRGTKWSGHGLAGSGLGK